jgi:hypothetical protein
MYRVIGGANGIPSILSQPDEAFNMRCSIRETELVNGFAEHESLHRILITSQTTASSHTIHMQHQAF